MKRVAIAALAAVAGCSSAPVDPDAARTLVGLEIAPYGIHETCLKLADGDRIDWRFESRAPVDFNIHYHEGASVIMPLSLAASFGGSGVLPVIVPHDYCAMWEAGPLGAVVTYYVKPLRLAR